MLCGAAEESRPSPRPGVAWCSGRPGQLVWHRAGLQAGSPAPTLSTRFAVMGPEDDMSPHLPHL